MIVSGLVKTSLVDFPGRVACVLFVPGCNFDCFYCHNRELIRGSREALDLRDIWAFLEKRTGQLDGVVVTGGEPTLQKDLLSFLRQIKMMGYAVKLDTNGSSPIIAAQAVTDRLCDYVAVDYKAPRERYAEICGEQANAEPVLSTISFLLNSGVPFEVRTTVVPQLGVSDLLAMANELPKLPRYCLNRYRKPEYFLEKDRERIDKTPYSQQEIEQMAEAIRAVQPNVVA